MTRLDYIASLVDERVVIDIGSDHGFLVKKLFDSNQIDCAFVTDISQKCLKKAKSNLTNYNNIIYLCGDGLNVFNNNLPANLDKKYNNYMPNAVVIAGMGGEEIIKILSQKSAKHFNKFILAPQRNLVLVREYLCKHNFEIVSDKVVKEGKMFYNVIVAIRSKTKQRLSEEELVFGLTNIHSPDKDFLLYMQFLCKQYLEILSNKEVSSIRAKYDMLQSIMQKNKKI